MHIIYRRYISSGKIIMEKVRTSKCSGKLVILKIVCYLSTINIFESQSLNTGHTCGASNVMY